MQRLNTIARIGSVVTAVALLTPACGKKKASGDADEKGAMKPAPMGDAMEPPKARKAAPEWVWKKLPKMKLSVLVPAKAKVEESKQDAWNADINTPDYDFRINVVTVTGMYGGFKSHIKDEEKHHSLKFVKWITKKKTPQGFQLVGEHKDDEGKANFIVVIRTTVGKSKFQCWQRTEKKSELPAILKACHSIKAL